MDWSKPKRVFWWLVPGMFIGVLLVGCGTVHVPMQVTHPAEINMAKYKQVAVNPIGGNLGHEFYAELKDRLDQSGRFVMVDRAKLSQVMTEQQLTGSDLAQSSKGPKMGQILAASAIVSGAYNGRYNENVTYEDETRYRDRRDKVGYRVRIFTRTGTLDTTGNVDVIDAETTQILKSKSLTNRCQESHSAEGGTPEGIDQNALRSQCVKASVDKFMKAISPWTEVVRAPFKTDGDLPTLEAGVNQAKIGNMQAAAEIFQEAAKNSEMNPKISPSTRAKAYWNLGLAYTYSDQHDKALEAFNKSYALDPSSDCAKEIANCKKLKMEKRKLDEQNQQKM